MTEFLTAAGLVLLVASGALYALFCVRFGLRKHWARYPEGRHMMRLSAAMAATMFTSAAFRVFPIPVEVALWVQFVLLSLVTAEGVARNRLINGHDHRGDADVG